MSSEQTKLFDYLPETLSVKQLAAKLGVDSTTVHRWITQYLFETPSQRSEGGGHVTGARRGGFALTHEQIAKLTLISIFKDHSSGNMLAGLRIENGLNTPNWFTVYGDVIKQKLHEPPPKRK